MLENYGFRQTHASYIVNLNYVTQIGDRDVELENGEQIPLSKKRKAEFIQAMECYYSDNN